VELSLLRLALSVKRKTEGVGPRRRGDTSTGSSSVAHLGPFASFLAVGGEGGRGVCSGNICSTPSSSSSSLSVKSMIWRFLFSAIIMGLRNVLGPGRFKISGEELSLALGARGAGLERGVGNIGFGDLVGARAVTGLRGLRRITIASDVFEEDPIAGGSADGRAQISSSSRRLDRPAR
jgi:hypothetical protein